MKLHLYELLSWIIKFAELWLVLLFAGNVFISVNEGLSVATQRPQYTGLLNAAGTIFRQSGVRGLYQGVTPNVWGAGASWGLYFLG